MKQDNILHIGKIRELWHAQYTQSIVATNVAVHNFANQALFQTRAQMSE